MRYLWVIIFIIFGFSYILTVSNDLNNKTSSRVEVAKNLVTEIQNDNILYYLNSLNDNQFKFDGTSNKNIINHENIGNENLEQDDFNDEDIKQKNLIERVMSNLNFQQMILSKLDKSDLQDLILCGDIVILESINAENNSKTNSSCQDSSENIITKYLNNIKIFNNIKLTQIFDSNKNKNDKLFGIHIDESLIDLIGAKTNQIITINDIKYKITKIIKPFNFNLAKNFLLNKKNKNFECLCGKKVAMKIKIHDLRNGKILLFDTIKFKVGQPNHPAILDYIATSLQRFNQVVTILDKRLIDNFLNDLIHKSNKNQNKKIISKSSIVKNEISLNNQDLNLIQILEQYIEHNNFTLNHNNLIKIEASNI